MDAVTYLENYKKLNMIIVNKAIEKEHWEDIKKSITAGGGESCYINDTKTKKKVLHNMEKVQSSYNPQKMEFAICEALNLENEINDLIKEKNNIIKAIERLKPLEYDLVHMIYIQELTLTDVANKYHRSYSWATTLHSRALAHLQSIIDKKRV